MIVPIDADEIPAGEAYWHVYVRGSVRVVMPISNVATVYGHATHVCRAS